MSIALSPTTIHSTIPQASQKKFFFEKFSNYPSRYIRKLLENKLFKSFLLFSYAEPIKNHLQHIIRHYGPTDTAQMIQARP